MLFTQEELKLLKDSGFQNVSNRNFGIASKIISPVCEQITKSGKNKYDVYIDIDSDLGNNYQSDDMDTISFRSSTTTLIYAIDKLKELRIEARESIRNLSDRI